jgi:hypothetical protein
MLCVISNQYLLGCILLEYLTLVHHTRKVLGIYSHLDTQVHMVYLISNSPSKCRLYYIVHSVIGSYRTLSINIGLVESYSSIKYNPPKYILDWEVLRITLKSI